MKKFITQEESLPRSYYYSLIFLIFAYFLVLASLSTIFSLFCMWSSILVFFIFYDEIMHENYCHNRRLLKELLDTNSDLFTYVHYSSGSNLYYYTLSYDGNEYMISSSTKDNKLSLCTEKETDLIGYFASSFLQKRLVKDINSKLEKIKDKKVV